MGKSAPSAPAPVVVNAGETAEQQSAWNLQNAQMQNTMNMVDQYTPTGSMTYQQTGTKSITDPSGKVQEVPTYSMTTALNPDQQNLLNLQTQAQTQYGQIANNQLGQVYSNLSNPFQTQAQLPTNISGSGNLQTPQLGGNMPGTVNYGSLPYANTPDLGSIDRLATPDYMGVNMADRPDLAGSANPMGQYNYMNLMGGQNTADYAQVANMPDIPDYSQLGAMPTADEGTRQAVLDSLIARQQPQFDQQRAALETQLVNQGFQRGTQAFDDQMDQFNRSMNDFRLAADAQAGDEMARQFGLQMAGRQQGVSELDAGYGYGMDLRRQGIAEADTQWQQAMAGRNQDASLIGQQYAADMGLRQQDIAEMQAQYGMDTADYNRQLQTMGMQYGADLADRNQQLAEMQAQYALDNQARAIQMADLESLYGQQMEQAQLANQYAGQQYQLDAAEAQRRFAEQQAMYAQQTDAYNRQLQQDLMYRQQPLSELSTLLTGSQPTYPTMNPYPTVNMQAPDIASMEFANANAINTANQQAYQAALANQQGFTKGLFGLGGALGGAYLSNPALFTSDRRLKENIELVGKRGDGIGVYNFTFKDDPDGVVHTGVMADEVEKVYPDAVVTGQDGYKMVNYAAI